MTAATVGVVPVRGESVYMKKSCEKEGKVSLARVTWGRVVLGTQVYISGYPFLEYISMLKCLYQ